MKSELFQITEDGLINYDGKEDYRACFVMGKLQDGTLIMRAEGGSREYLSGHSKVKKNSCIQTVIGAGFVAYFPSHKVIAFYGYSSGLRTSFKIKDALNAIKEIKKQYNVKYGALLDTEYDYGINREELFSSDPIIKCLTEKFNHNSLLKHPYGSLIEYLLLKERLIEF